MFLWGALAVLLRGDVDLSVTAFGLIVAFFWAAASLTAISCGSLVDRLRSNIALALAAMGSATALLILSKADSWLLSGVGMILAGASSAMGQLATARLLAGVIRPERQGIAFGVQLSAIPLATLLGGLAVPVAATISSWRASFLFACLLAVLVAVVSFAFAGTSHSTGRPLKTRLSRRPLVLLGVATGLVTTSATAIAAFVVEFLTVRTGDLTLSGLVFSFSSFVAIIVRLGLGIWLDAKQRSGLLTLTLMFAIGGAGVLLLSLWGHEVSMVVALVLAYSVGWGWAGLLVYVIVRRYHYAPAAATGVVQSGIFLGAMVGPLVYGAVIDTLGFELAWRIASLGYFGAAILMGLSQGWIYRHWFRRISDSNYGT